MKNKRIPCIPLAACFIAFLLWATVLLSRGRAGVVAWWAVQIFGLTGPFLFICSLIMMIGKKKRILRGILTAALSLFISWPLLWIMDTGKIPFPADPEKSVPSLTIESPFRETVLTGWGGNGPGENYHVVVPVERWAYDIIRPPYSTGSTDPEDYGIFDMPVYAPAPGTVVDCRGDLPDRIPGDEGASVDEMKGNYVYIELESTGTYLLMAHFREDTLAVSAGDYVTQGRYLGRIGNSGSSSEPHLHIHHQRDDPRKSSLFTARGLPLYFNISGIPVMPRGGDFKEAIPPRAGEKGIGEGFISPLSSPCRSNGPRERLLRGGAARRRREPRG